MNVCYRELLLLARVWLLWIWQDKTYKIFGWLVSTRLDVVCYQAWRRPRLPDRSDLSDKKVYSNTCCKPKTLQHRWPHPDNYSPTDSVPQRVVLWFQRKKFEQRASWTPVPYKMLTITEAGTQKAQISRRQFFFLLFENVWTWLTNFPVSTRSGKSNCSSCLAIWL